MLAWYDGVYELQGLTDSINNWVNSFINNLFMVINENDIPVGHLKFLVSDSKNHQKISITSGYETQDLIGLTVDNWLSPVTFVINARLECEQKVITKIMRTAIELRRSDHFVKVKLVDEEAFHPGFPSPTYRLVN